METISLINRHKMKLLTASILGVTVCHINVMNLCLSCRVRRRRDTDHELQGVAMYEHENPTSDPTHSWIGSLAEGDLVNS
jgi:hypothetical protein